jgi:hypothetical protein
VIAGHFGFAAAVKSRAPETPLWALMLATVWLDVVFIPLLLTHVEYIEPVGRTSGGYGTNIIHADYTHSLLGVVLLSASLGIPAALRWGRRSGVIVGLVVASHWFLDLIVHRADMPILPANVGHLPLLGFGLWRYPSVSAGVELALVLVGAWLYWNSAMRVVRSAGRGKQAAIASTALIAIFGVLILWMDVTAS